ncbi:MAG: ABC transporter substrate-binding protein [Bacteroidota bacterium]
MNNASKFFFCLFLLVLLASSCQQDHSSSSEEQSPTTNTSPSARVISLSGFLTEVLMEMGHVDKLVGRDVTSTYPDTLAERLPNLGHVSQLNAEAILELKPDLIFVEEASLGRSEVFKQLENAGITIAAIPTATHLNNAITAAQAINKHLPTQASDIERLAKQIEQDSLKLASKLASSEERPKVLFIYARGTSRLMVAGINTSASAIIEKAGGQNAIQSFDDFRPLTAEALVEASPDVILMFTSGLASLDGKEGLSQVVGLDQTPAYKNDRIIAMDGHYLTAFGPRAAKAALELAEGIHKED